MFESKKKIDKIVKQAIQAMAEGAQEDLTMESLMTGTVSTDGTEGVSNSYKAYDYQVSETYAKYNGRRDLGNFSVRAIVDIRTGFIAGEGLSVTTHDEELGKFFEKLLVANKLKGSRLTNFVKGGEMEGKQLLYVDTDSKGNIKILRKATKHSGGVEYKVHLNNPDDIDDIKKITVRDKDGSETALDLKSFKYVKLGGDSSSVNETTTRVGVILKYLDNYDRAINVMRKANHLFGRPTPFFETSDYKDALNLTKLISKLGWKVGMALAGPGKMSMVSPTVAAMENIKQELLVYAKVIAATTGIPIHWIGWVDTMNNRSTAETLYETILNATAQDRAEWAEAFYDLFLKAQEIAVDNGELKKVSTEFQVKIPLISFSKMLNLIQALHLAKEDGAISMDDYRGALPNIDPYKTKKAIEAETREDVANFNRLEVADDTEEEDLEEEEPDEISK